MKFHYSLFKNIEIEIYIYCSLYNNFTLNNHYVTFIEYNLKRGAI